MMSQTHDTSLMRTLRKQVGVFCIIMLEIQIWAGNANVHEVGNSKFKQCHHTGRERDDITESQSEKTPEEKNEIQQVLMYKKNDNNTICTRRRKKA